MHNRVPRDGDNVWPSSMSYAMLVTVCLSCCCDCHHIGENGRTWQ